MNVLYLHGMGGGEDSRIPSILKEAFADDDRVGIIVRTYDFDPETATVQIYGWMSELEPVLVIGESLGSIHALRITGVPHILVSPALNAPLYLGYLAFLALIPGIPQLLGAIYRPRPGKRQALDFHFRTLRKYRHHRRMAIRCIKDNVQVKNICFAFFGTHDHYRRSGVVSIRSWRRFFGSDSYAVYDGTHFMEEEYIHSLLIPKIREILDM